jgi:hypothetical protein
LAAAAANDETTKLTQTDEFQPCCTMGRSSPKDLLKDLSIPLDMILG